jgi:thiol-disulfide isomerase/thioredoxin
MTRLVRFAWPGLFALLGVMGGGAISAQEKAAGPEVTLRTVKYDELGRVVKGLKGKVVVVDFWADFCVPCKREFPKLVALYEKQRDNGFAAVSVAVDPDVQNKELGQRLLKFLQRQRAAFTNLWLDEPAEVWQKKLNTPTVPCVFVFNKAGQIARKYTDDVNYEEIAKLVGELLGEK